MNEPKPYGWHVIHTETGLGVAFTTVEPEEFDPNLTYVPVFLAAPETRH